MFKEYRFVDPAKALQKRKQLKQEFGYDFPLYKIEHQGRKWLGIVYPEGLQPNPKRKR